MFLKYLWFLRSAYIFLKIMKCHFVNYSDVCFNTFISLKKNPNSKCIVHHDVFRCATHLLWKISLYGYFLSNEIWFHYAGCMKYLFRKKDKTLYFNMQMEFICSLNNCYPALVRGCSYGGELAQLGGLAHQNEIWLT